MQDYLTKYPEAMVVKSTAAKDNIKVLEEVFGRHGYPDKMVTDNGPPWNGTEYHIMKQYLDWAGVQHCPTVSSDDPEANGLAEKFMQVIGNSWESAYVEGKDPIAALNAKLMMYRNTQHAVTRCTPAGWLFERTIRTRLPDMKLQTQQESEASRAAKVSLTKVGEIGFPKNSN